VLMSFKLKDLQDLAESKGREYYKEKGHDCLPSTILAINDALKDVDDVNYADPIVLKATSPLRAGFGVFEGPCGAVTAGAVAIGLKFSTSDVNDHTTINNAGRKSAEWLRWFKYQMFGSYNCFDIKATPFERERCTNVVTQSAKKLVDILTEGNPKVTR
jgi:hypothetical protein